MELTTLLAQNVTTFLLLSARGAHITSS